MSPEQNKELIRRYLEEAWNRGNLAILGELQDPEYVEHSKQFIPMWRRAFPDFHISIDTLVAEGNTVVVGSSTQGTHLGTLEGHPLPSWFPQPLPPTGKRIDFRGIFFYSIDTGRIERKNHWGVLDWITIVRQLGFTISFDRVSD